MAAWRTIMMAAVAFVAAGLGTLGLGGAVAEAPVSFPTSQLEIVNGAGASHGFAVEVATSHQQLAQGLMYRRTLAPDAGMLFDFGEPQPVTMWMKNTLIPLDMVFIAANGAVLGIAERTVPQSLAVIASPGPVRAVLELNGGTADRLGIHAGDRVRHPLFSEGLPGN